jgi:hypothetical protein
MCDDLAYVKNKVSTIEQTKGDADYAQFNCRCIYAPEPPFNRGTPKIAPPAALEKAWGAVQAITKQRQSTAERVARQLEIPLPSGEQP